MEIKKFIDDNLFEIKFSSGAFTVMFIITFSIGQNIGKSILASVAYFATSMLILKKV